MKFDRKSEIAVKFNRQRDFTEFGLKVGHEFGQLENVTATCSRNCNVLDRRQ